MSNEVQIPILRLGEEYRSLDTVNLETGGGRQVCTHTANPGLIRRDLLNIEKSRAALNEVPAETLADYCEKAADIFLNEDLTHLNQTVLLSVRKKTPDEVEDAWYSNGKIFKKDKMNDVTIVPFEEYQDWLDLPFPKDNTHF